MRLFRSSRRTRRLFLAVVFGGVAASFCLSFGTTRAAIFDQDALITQTNPDYLYLQSEWFDRTIADSDDMLWTVGYNNSGPHTATSPNQENNNNPSNSFAIYSLLFSDPGVYNFYAYRIGGSDSMFPPPDFNADPYQEPNFNGTGQPGNRNRWNSIDNNKWMQMGGGGSDAPSGEYYVTGTVNYEVTQAQVDAGVPLEFKIGGREDNVEYDRFLFHKAAGLDGGTIDGLTFADAVVNNQMPEPVVSFTPVGPTGGTGFMGVREVTGNGNIGNQAAAQESLAGGGGTIVDYTAAVLNIRDSDGNGNFGDDALYASDSDQVDSTNNTVDHISVIAQGTIRVPAGQGGEYTFGVNSDDGFTVIFPGQDFSSATNAGLPLYEQGRALQYFGGRGAGDSLGVINLPEGDHPFILTHHEGSGGASVEFFAAQGAHTAFDRDLFNLVGGPAIPAVDYTEPPAVAAAWSVDVIYDDGAGSDIRGLNESITAMEAFWGGTLTPAVAAHEDGVATINYADPQGGGGGHAEGGPQIPFPGDTGVSEDGFVVGAKGSLVVETEGDYTFRIFGDDGMRFRIPGSGDGWVVSGGDVTAFTDGYRLDGCCHDAFGTVHLTPGSHDMELIWNEVAGGAYVGVWAQFEDDAWFLVGDTTSLDLLPVEAGLELVPEPSTLAMLLGLAALGLFQIRRRK